MPPLLINLILGGVVLEAVILSAVLRRRARPLVPALLFFLGSGAALLTAVRLAIGDAGLAPIGGVLLLAGVLHVGCLLSAVKTWRQGHDSK